MGTLGFLRHVLTTRHLLRLLLNALLISLGLAAAAAPGLAAWDQFSWTRVFQPTAVTDEISTAPDGQGGSLLIMHDPGAAGPTLRVSRLDHTGNKVWGDSGIPLPSDATATGMAGPVAVVDDGAGGGYFLFTRIEGSAQTLMMERRDAAGGFVWRAPLGDYGPNPAPAASLHKSANGDLLVAWNRTTGIVDKELIVLRLTPAGIPLWETTVWQDGNNTLDTLDWIAAEDGSGGLVFAIDHQSFSGLYEARTQRIDAGGNVLWGPQGTQLWSTIGSAVGVLPDNAGGAYLMNSLGWGDTRVQHVNAAGTATWTAGGIALLALNTWPNPSRPSFCVDGSGGFFAADGVTDLFAQHIDIFGNRLWGAAGLQITTLDGFQQDSDLAPDGFGGVLVVYRDHYFSAVGDSHARALSALRLDAFGNTIWRNDGFFWTLTDGATDRTPYYPRIHADGSGGAQVAWVNYNDNYTFTEILAAGLGPDGSSPAVPTLSYLTPDAGASGDVQTAYVLGDYLEDTQIFKLVQGGSPELVLTGVTSLTPQVVTGSLDLGAAQPGAYDLQLFRDGIMLASLANAYGIGEPLPCDQDEPLPVAGPAPVGFGSQRKLAFDSTGAINAGWLQETGSASHLFWQVRTPDLVDGGTDIYQTEVTTRELAVAVGPDDLVHFAFVEDNGSSTSLVHLVTGPNAGTVVVSARIQGGVRNPALAISQRGEVHIVYESAAGGPGGLFHVTVQESDFSTPTDLGAGTNATNPDLTVDGEGLMLTFVRDFWWPGTREVCSQQFDGHDWAPPAGLMAGVDVQSPSVAWDGDRKLLFGWVLDNTGSDPLLHTLLMQDHVAGPVRWRLGLPLVYRTSVAASGPDSFCLLSQESESGIPMEIFLRRGDGEVFYPRRRLNSGADVDFPFFCAQFGNPGVAAMWASYENPGQPLFSYDCWQAGIVSPVPEVAVNVGLAAFPNPFNPETTFSYSQRTAGWTRLAIYDLAGRLVRTLSDGFQAAGEHRATWDGRDAGGRVVASGVYFSRLLLPDSQPEVVTKVTMLK